MRRFLLILTLLAISPFMLHAQSIDKLTKRAKRGNAEAQFNLGYSYFYGDGVAQDYADAAEWFRMAAKKGYAAAQYNLAMCYDKGYGVEQNDAEAQYNLGVCYFYGKGVQQSYNETVKWLRKAAKQNHAEAQYLLRNLGASW